MAGALTKAQLITQNSQLLGTVQSGADLLTQANRLNNVNQHRIDALQTQLVMAVGAAAVTSIGFLANWLSSATPSVPSLISTKAQIPACNKNATIVTLLQPDPRTAQELQEAQKQLNVTADQLQMCTALRQACEGQAAQVTADKTASDTLLKACEGQFEQLTADKAASATALQGCEGEKSQLITNAATTKDKTKALFDNFKTAQQEVEDESSYHFQKWEECLANLNKFATQQKP